LVILDSSLHIFQTTDEGPARNPTLEEQALARIHRLGQTREVTTVRFFIRNSFEEVRFRSLDFNSTNSVLTMASQQVIELQASKKQLAGVILSPHEGDKTNDNLGRLHVRLPRPYLQSQNSSKI
jgi:hypothetical protein